ncbi:acyl-CoA dehydrogenase family protein [Pontibacillus salicampi]|uniref:Acyl-CoA dehydrogenase family protein n=1 Tax=Pontibacillus salicampi TaxID=1449801 RepID=A0ABV6LKY6_9BACI
MSTVAKWSKGAQFLVQDTSSELVFTPEDRTDEQRMIEQTTLQFIEKEVIPQKERIENQDFPLVAKLMRKAGELGLLAHSIPERFGGLGLDKVSKGIVGGSLGGASGYSVAHSNHTCIATLPITYFGTEEQKERYLPKLASGEYIGAYCLTEPEAGSDALSAKTSAVLNEEGTHYVLNGTKIYITNASFAHTFIVYAKVDGKHFSAFIVEKNFPGLTIGPEEQKMGIKGSSTCSVILEDCHVPVENLLGEVGKGHLIALNVLNLGRYNLGFATTGAAKSVLKETLEQITERKQFGKSIAEFPATKEKIARLGSRLYATEAVMYRTGGLVEGALEGLYESDEYQTIAKAMNEHSLESAICKVMGSETLDEMVDEGVQLQGGAGFIKEYPIEQAYRDARINRIFEGTNEINRLLIPGVFFKKAAKGEFDAKSVMEKAQVDLQQHSTALEDLSISEQMQSAVTLIRNLFLVCAGAAYEKYGEAMKEEQELLMRLANLAISLYGVESAVLRTLKAGEKSDCKQELTMFFIREELWQVERNAKELAMPLLKGDIQKYFIHTISTRINEYLSADSLPTGRSIADTFIREKKYVC